MPHFLHVRSSAELDDLIKDELRALRTSGAPEALLNRSVLVRSLLTAVLRTRKGQPIRDERGSVLDGAALSRGLKIETARELVQQVVVALERATDKALANAMVQLPGYLEAELGLSVQQDDVIEMPPPAARRPRNRATRAAAAG